ncbi:MAG TPA: hypothetical protein VFA74_09795 [Terriglobales bacterium]|nr:hypothetical protein [Terriglobales bacterium]
MKRTKTKGSGAKAKTPRATNTGKPVEFATVREQISKLVGNNAVNMVKTTMKEVDKGRFLGMKLLFELVGLYPASGSEESPAADSMAKTLLRRLQLPEELTPETDVTKDCEADRAPTANDTVK